MAQLFVFGGLIVVGVIVLIVLKIRWSRQASQKWNVPESERKLD